MMQQYCYAPTPSGRAKRIPARRASSARSRRRLWERTENNLGPTWVHNPTVPQTFVRNVCLSHCSNCKRPIAQNKTAPGGDTGAVSRARRLLSAAERHLVDGIDQPIATFVERVRQQVRVLRNLAMDALQTRLHERIHEAGEEAF